MKKEPPHDSLPPPSVAVRLREESRRLGRGLVRRALPILQKRRSARIASAIIAAFVVVALVGPLFVSAAGDSHAPVFAPPLSAHGHLFGTDRDGRDMLARLVQGTRTSVGVAFAGVLLMAPIGVGLGALAGFFRGFIDNVVSRLIEALSSFPSLLLVLAVQALVPHPTVWTLLVAIALTRWTEIARLVRAEMLRVACSDYVLAARALGAGQARLLLRHALPNALAPAFIAATFAAGTIVLVQASLDFLHVGVPSDIASWGETMSEASDKAGAWWLLAFPGTLLFLLVAAMNLLGEAVRDALDPRMGPQPPHPPSQRNAPSV